MREEEPCLFPPESALLDRTQRPALVGSGDNASARIDTSHASALATVENHSTVQATVENHSTVQGTVENYSTGQSTVEREPRHPQFELDMTLLTEMGFEPELAYLALIRHGQIDVALDNLLRAS